MVFRPLIIITSATIASFILGSLWYSPLMFGRLWQKEMGYTDEDLKESNMLVAIAGTLLLTIVHATCLWILLLLLHSKPGLPQFFGTRLGLLLGLGLIAPCFGINALYEKRSLTLLLINAGHHVISLVVMSTIIGLFLA